MAATVAPDLFPAGFRDAHGVVPVYFEAAAVIVTLVLLGQVLELRARRQTGVGDPRAARPRPDDRPPGPPDGTEEDVPLGATFSVGDRLRVRPGEKVPVDGDVAEGDERGGRVDGDRRADAGDEASRATR